MEQWPVSSGARYIRAALMAIDKMIGTNAQADPELPRPADVPHKAMGSISAPPYGMAPKADWDGVHEALGRVFASVPELTVMDGYNSVSSITDSGVPAYLKSLVNGADAEKAYAGFLSSRLW